MKNILFIVPKCGYNTLTPPLSLGALSIASYLKALDYNVKVFDRSIELESLNHLFASFEPDIVGVSVLSQNALKDAIVVSKFFHRKSIPTVWGGMFPSSMPDIVIKEDYVDYVSFGEGEKTWEELLFALNHEEDVKSIKGLALKEPNGSIIINEERELLKGDEIPFVDYSLIDAGKYTIYMGDGIGKRFMWLNSSKGCPHHCAFCSNASFNHSSHRNKLKNVYLSEIEYLLTQTDCDGIYFADDTWAITKEEIHRKCQELQDISVPFTWAAFLNLGFLNKEDYEYLYENGCRVLYFGIESGSASELKRVRKPLKLDRVIPELEACASAGIVPHASFVLGCKDQTLQEAKETAELMKAASRFARLMCYEYVPYKGSEMYSQLAEEKRIPLPQSLKGLVKSKKQLKNARISELSRHEIKVILSYASLWGLLRNAIDQSTNHFQLIFHSLSNIFTHWQKNEENQVNIKFLLDLSVKYIFAILQVFFCRYTAKKLGLSLLN
ncbi:MAG: B12-binding domain-containing radical SAM protein [Clostridia bacterium]|nr:B12-binding domain-containing radical SAM protein [Clostridia bacterium]